MYGASANNSIGSASAGIGPANARARFFNPYPIQKYATG